MTNKKGAAQPSATKQSRLKTLKEKFAASQSSVIVDYQGLSVTQQTKLRQQLTAAGGELVVTKNSLINLMFGKQSLKQSLKGMNAVLFGHTDPIEPIKALFKFHQETQKLTIKQGFMEGKVLETDEVEALSKLPSKKQLIATLISRIQGPAYGLANVLSAGPRNLVYALSAIAKK